MAIALTLPFTLSKRILNSRRAFRILFYAEKKNAILKAFIDQIIHKHSLHIWMKNTKKNKENLYVFITFSWNETN